MMKGKYYITALILLIVGNVFNVTQIIDFNSNEGDFIVYFLDINQGDATLIKTPSNKYVLIDGGPGDYVLEEIGEVISPFTRRIDIVIATHPDKDHVEGLIELVNRFDVKNIFINKVNSNSEIYQELRDSIRMYNITNFQVSSLNDFIFDNVSFNFIWPSSDINPFGIKDINDTSISTVISFDGLDLYVAGDLSTDYEIAALNIEKIQDIDVWKVSHHGSKTSTPENLIGQFQPDYAIISAGKNNQYGHPTQEVIDVFNKYGVAVVRTDLNGRIELVYSRNNINVLTER